MRFFGQSFLKNAQKRKKVKKTFEFFFENSLFLPGENPRSDPVHLKKLFQAFSEDLTQKQRFLAPASP